MLGGAGSTHGLVAGHAAAIDEGIVDADLAGRAADGVGAEAAAGLMRRPGRRGCRHRRRPGQQSAGARNAEAGAVLAAVAVGIDALADLAVGAGSDAEAAGPSVSIGGDGDAQEGHEDGREEHCVWFSVPTVKTGDRMVRKCSIRYNKGLAGTICSRRATWSTVNQLHVRRYE